MTCYAIMQPTFLPWAGYFRLMAKVAKFAYLDDVQLARQSWQTRNRVLLNGKAHWIVVPIEHVALEQTICDTRITQAERWRQKTARLLTQTYARHPHFGDLEALIHEIETGTETRVAELNIGLATLIAENLRLAPQVFRTSRMAIKPADRVERLIEIGERLDCDQYLSPVGAFDYLMEGDFAGKTAITLEFLDETPPPYPQRGAAEFTSHLSIVDVVANLGWNGAADYVRAPWSALPPGHDR